MVLQTWISKKLITDPAVNIASRVDSPNYSISTRSNIDQATSDMSPGLTIIAGDRVDVS